jgi:predicted lipoprotein
MTRVRKVQTQTVATVSEVLHLVSKGIAMVALGAPYLLMLVVTVQCTQLKAKGQRCEGGSAMAATVQHVTTVAFAWLATPPQ